MKEYRRTAYNSKFTLGGVSCSADSFVVTESSVLPINICGENRLLRQATNRYKLCKTDIDKQQTI